MTYKNMKAVHSTDVDGKTIRKVYVGDKWVGHRTSTKVPDSKHLTNFNLKAGKRTFLVLDNYGNDYLTSEIEGRISGPTHLGGHGHGWLLAIDRASGEIFTCFFYTEKKQLVAVLSQTFESKPKVPKQYLQHLDNLKSCKRPWMLTWRHEDWAAFTERETSWSDFMGSVVISLELFLPSKKDHTRTYLEVWGESHRIVSAWR